MTGSVALRLFRTKAVVSLLCGGAAGTGVAWLCALLVLVPTDFGGGSECGVTEADGLGWFVSIETGFGRQSIERQVAEDCSVARISGLERLTVPYWSASRSRPSETHLADSASLLYEDAAGWPFAGLVGYARIDLNGDEAKDAGSKAVGLRWGLPIESGGPSDVRPRLLPLKPIALGFIGNTLTYGLVVWLTLTTVVRLRRLGRRVSGLCEYCGYDLRGGDWERCPECGKAISN
jgi:hypothetical protein